MYPEYCSKCNGVCKGMSDSLDDKIDDFFLDMYYQIKFTFYYFLNSCKRKN
jgi:hypothetical protein